MSQKLYEENNIQDIANAIRTKNGTHDAYTVAQMGNAIRAIKAQPNLESLTANQNGTYTPSGNKDGFSEVTVNVPSSEPDLETLTATENRTYTPSANKDGFSEVTVNVPPTVPDLETLTATENGTYTPSGNKDGFSEVTVDVPGSANLYPIFTRTTQGYIDAANAVIATINGRPYYKYDATPACAGYFYDGRYTNLILVSTTPEGCWYQCQSGVAHSNVEIISHTKHFYVTIPTASMNGNRSNSNGPAYKLSDDALTTSEAQQLLVNNATNTTWLVDHNGDYELPEGYDGFKPFNVNVPHSVNLYPIFTRTQGYIDTANGVIATLYGRPYYKYDATPACAGYFYDGRYTNLILVSTTPEGCWYQCQFGDAHSNVEIISHTKHFYVTIPTASMNGNRSNSNGPAYKLSDDALTTSEAQQLLVNNATNTTWLVDHNGEYEVPEGYDGFKSFNVNISISGLANMIYGNALPSSAIGKDKDVYLLLGNDITNIRMSIYKGRDNQAGLQLTAICLIDTEGNYIPWRNGGSSSNGHVYSGAQGADKAFDNNISGSTKWYTDSKLVTLNPIWIMFEPSYPIDPSSIKSWCWYTGDDVPNRDPISFDLEVSYNHGQSYITIDSVQDANIPTTRNAIGYSNDIIIPTVVNTTISDAYVKKNGTWQALFGSDISDVNTNNT